jgi:hypothetical protein
MEIRRRLLASNEPEEVRRWDARRPDPGRRRLRFEKSRLGRGNTICPDTSSRSQSIAVLSRHQAGVRIEFPRPDIKLTFAGIRATTARLGALTECGTTSDRTETRPTADLGSRSRPASGSSRMTVRDGERALTDKIASGPVCRVTSKSEWHFLALIGTPGKVSSANSPSPERTPLGCKPPIFGTLCRWITPVPSTGRPMNRDEYAHSSARDVTRGRAPGQNGMQSDRATDDRQGRQTTDEDTQCGACSPQPLGSA